MIRLITLGLIGFLVAASAASAQQPDRMPRDSAGRPMRGPMTQSMMMMVDSMDARLDSLVTVMNRAQGTSRIDAMAAVINEMASQRKVMRAHMRDGTMRGSHDAESRRGAAGLSDARHAACPRRLGQDEMMVRGAPLRRGYSVRREPRGATLSRS